MLTMYRDLTVEVEDEKFYTAISEDQFSEKYLVVRTLKRGKPRVWYPYQTKLYEESSERVEAENAFEKITEAWEKKNLRRPICVAIAENVGQTLELRKALYIGEGKDDNKLKIIAN